LSEFGCNDLRDDNLKIPVAGLDPATHVSFDAESAANEDVDDRSSPVKGSFAVEGRKNGRF